MDPDEMRSLNRSGYNAGRHHEAHRADRELHDAEQRLIDRLLEPLSTQPRVLDLGCGSGVPFDRYLVEQGCDVVGIDIADDHIAAAREQVPDATYVQTPFTDLSPVDGQFDAAICLYALIHAHRDDHGRIFAQVADRLGDGGRFLVTISRKERAPETKSFAGAELAVSAWTEEKTLGLLRDAGFSIQETEPIRDAPDLWPYTGVIAER